MQKYLNTPGPDCKPDPKQRWLTFVRNHANAIVASDFFVVVTAQFRILYVFVCIELGTRRILHYNVTAHPTAEWTLQGSVASFGTEQEFEQKTSFPGTWAATSKSALMNRF